MDDNSAHDSADARTSEARRMRQMQAVERFIAAAESAHLSLENTENLYSPRALVTAMRRVWQWPGFWDGFQGRFLTPRQIAHACIFLPRQPDGRRNPDMVKRWDARILPMVEGIMEEYLLCHHWETLATRHEGESGKLHDCVEEVRAQIASYYVTVLEEQYGYTTEEAVKIVGNAIKAFWEVAKIAGTDLSKIQPVKTSRYSLREMARRIHAHADDPAALGRLRVADGR